MLPEIVLDDVRFQELVSEARTRIVRHSPEWTEHNVSDPGITLIELFAWLTEILVYRINRIPERLHLSLLGLVGVHPSSPECATAELRFILATATAATTIPAGTAVASPRTTGVDAVVFETTGDLAIPAGTLSAQIAASDDLLLIGFEESVAGLVVRVQLDSTRVTGAEIDPDHPPLVWEASGPDGGWLPVDIVDDETGGFTFGGGAVTLDLPGDVGATSIARKRLHWLRCRATSTQAYREPPEITAVSASVVGATVAAGHSELIVDEEIGVSDGVSGTVYQLQRRPVRPLLEGETLEVREPESDRWVPWRHVETFAHSTGWDPHFHLDHAGGEVRFGPAVRQPDGGWRRYGAVPPAGATLRFSSYRHGGGSAGNVASRALSVLQTPIAGVASVTNPRAASGGVDAETLARARERAMLSIRARSRAVTVEDFERLTLEASPRVARVVCAPPDEGGPVRVHILPKVSLPDRRLELAELTPDEELMATVASALDERRLLGTSVRLLPVRLKGVSVVADLRASPLADLERVEQDVAHALYVYLNPLIGGSTDGPGEGWPLGRALNQGELYGIAYRIPGVEFVNILRVYETDLKTGAQAAQPAEAHIELAPDELIASGSHIIKVSYRE
jgi:predicted phage baseplate assembly protein